MSLNAWRNWSLWTMNRRNLSTLQVFRTFSHKCKTHYLQCCQKNFIRFLCKCLRHLLGGKPAKHKKRWSLKILKQFSTFVSKTNNLEAKKRHFRVRRRLLAHKIPLLINHLPRDGAVCPHSCFCVQKEFENPVNYTAGASKLSTFKKSPVSK